MRNMKSLGLKMREVTLAISAMLAAAAAAAVSAADVYPTKPIRLIVSTTPGGANDTNARLMSFELSTRLGQQVVVDNRAGGGGRIGTEIAAKAEPDGYTLFLVVTTNTIQPSLQKLPYDTLKAFIPIARTGCGTAVLSVHPSVPAKSVKELITLAKQKPGDLMFSSSGAGSTAHLQTELFKEMAGIDFRVVQYRSAGPAIIALVGGHNNASLGSIASMLPHIRSSRLRALGTSGDERHFALPDVPTIAEAGVPGYSSTSWYGISAPAGTPAPIVDRLTKEIEAALSSPEVRQRFRNRGTEACYLGGPEAFGPFIAQEMVKWERLIKNANIKAGG